ncbi:hypothetical protein B0H63DRAFT_482274 [Podospora didyma]|uniref:non-specific serine/threonine protein kinase n=1 Tax=Podospora didyma TaxID=330526 RepID=A0AAE0KFI4_9PEZI|nr:hypothetical protein B0H63DRAFT_482274 [Podospora didyma]
MPRPATTRKYGKPIKRTRAEELFAALPKSPGKKVEQPQPQPEPKTGLEVAPEEKIQQLAEKLFSVTLEGERPVLEDKKGPSTLRPTASPTRALRSREVLHVTPRQPTTRSESPGQEEKIDASQGLRILTWDDVCSSGDRIEKIAEASYAEVYRITNERGTSIIKVIRLDSPIKAQTKAQEKSGLVDEEPHSEDDLRGELKISEWLADVPGFVVYKERYVVRGRAPKALLETHQVFHRKMKRKDPDRLQFYPSPSRYLDDTRFLVVELGDAGVALEDFELSTVSQVWDIFLHTAVALARAEDLVRFEHRDLHEGNLCIWQARPPKPKPEEEGLCQFGYSGLEITILDYGLSRAENVENTEISVVAYDFEKELGIFTSTHAPQCRVYRQMRSFLLKGDRVHLAPKSHSTPYDTAIDGHPISWEPHYPYTNVLWLAYIFQYLMSHFKGDGKELGLLKHTTKELLSHLDPEAPRQILSFPSAVDVKQVG